MIELIDEILQRTAAGEALAVCTVVRTRGSTPQKRGAVMVVLSDGHTRGTIGGGCVEAEVKTRALHVLGNPSARARGQLFTFQLDHDLGWDDGLICGGSMDVAVEVIDSPDRAAALEDARTVLAAGRQAAVQVTLPDDAGNPVTFQRTLDPAPTLLIAGAGHVGAALGTIAGPMGFHVVVIDDRPDLASAERFPPPARRVVAEVDTELARYPITPHTYVVIVTRGHRHDGRALAAVVNSDAKYVGLIGSKRKVVTIYQDLHAQGVSRERLARVHAPIGLDIGAMTPAEIAVSIAAELVAVRRGVADRPAAGMRLTPAQIDRVLSRERASGG